MCYYFAIMRAKIFLTLLVFVSTAFAQHRKSEWITEAFKTLKQSRYSRIKALSYWHENWDNDTKSILMRIDSSLLTLTAYRKGLKSLPMVTTPVFSNESEGNQKLLPPENGMYHAAYPDFGGLEDAVKSHNIFEFEILAQKKIIWAYFSNNWGSQVVFPERDFKAIFEKDRVPFVRIMLREGFLPQDGGSQITIAGILSGKYDKQILKWSTQVKELNKPVLIEFCPEPNSNWFPWSGTEVSPADYASAYQHIVELTREAGANNLTWFFHLNYTNVAKEKSIRFIDYYPGDEYVDWIGISLYGPSEFKEEYIPFEQQLSSTYEEWSQISPDKPLAILEWGMGEDN